MVLTWVLCGASAHASSKKRTRADLLQRDGQGKPYVLPSVQKAEEILFAEKGDKEYLPITVS